MEIKIIGTLEEVKGITERLIKKYGKDKTLSEVIKLEYGKDKVVLT